MTKRSRAFRALCMADTDAGARVEALDPARSFIVEAPAGSGKTGLLIQRFLRLLAEGNVESPSQVLAITFTRKATAELRQRVWHQLANAASGDEPTEAFALTTRGLARAVLAKDEALGWGLTTNPNLLNIRTIDSVCAEIARSLPILSGSGGALAPTENAAPLHAEAARRTLLLLGGTDETLNAGLESVLLHRDGNLANCEELLAEMLGMRDQWGELIPLVQAELTDEYLDGEVLPRLDAALNLAICRALTRLQQIVPAGALARLNALAEEMAHAEGYKGAPSPIALCRNRTQVPSERAEDLEHWRTLIKLVVKPSKPQDFRKSLSRNHIGFEILNRHKVELKELIEGLAAMPGMLEELCRIKDLPPAEYPRDQWPLAKALFRVLARALVELQFVFQAHAACDFTESALQAKAALQREGALDALRTASGSGLQHLLVDEMQDTSSSQYELLRLLTASWDGYSQTVFLVGDPKQSIYLFRQARVERFVQTLHHARLGDVPLTGLALTANFRSQGFLVEDFNTTFSLLFPAETDPTRAELVPYRRADAARAATPAEGQTWHATLYPYTADRVACSALKHEQLEADAQRIRAIAREWLAKPLPEGRTKPWTLAVLVRNRTHLVEILAAFKQAPAIPYRAVKIEPLGERREILDLLALTRALLHVADRTAWLALLRSPWCGLTLVDLHTLAGAPESRQTPSLTLLQDNGDLLTEDGVGRLAPFYRVMVAALGQRGRLPLARWVERTWNSFNGPAFANEEEMANATRFFELLHGLETTQGSVDFSTLEAQLTRLYAAPATAAGPVVELTTIHNAKGLEWDVVFLPALDRTSRSTTGKLLQWLETDASDDPSVAPGILAPMRSKGGAAQELNDWIRSIEQGREAAEATRLMYVACTRAREELHLFGTVFRKANGENAPTANSLLAAAWPAAEEHFLPEQERVIAANEPTGLALAAAAAPVIIRRIPALPGLDVTVPGALSAASRPQGNYLNRTFGNVLHAFLEQLAVRMGKGASAEELLKEVPAWQGRIEAVLRGAGVGAGVGVASQVLRGLMNTLESAEGRWLLAPHAEAATESASTRGDGSTSRLDRTFLAGGKALTAGASHLWIVDYKTASHAREGLEEFLEREAELYRGQLEEYGRQVGGGRMVRLALFYPMMGRLWVLEDV